MGNFHFFLVRYVDSHENLPILTIFVRIIDFACLFGRGWVSCLWSIDIIIVVFCEIVSVE